VNPHRHDRHRRLPWESGLGHDGGDPRGLVGLDLEEHQVGAGASGSLDPEFAQQVVLDQEQGAQQEGAKSEAQHHGHRLVGGTVEIGQSLADQVGPAPGKPAPDPADQPQCRQPASQQDHPAARGKDGAIAQVLDLHGRQQHDADDQQPGGADPQGIAPPPG
jgi:hypothetical protein